MVSERLSILKLTTLALKLKRTRIYSFPEKEKGRSFFCPITRRLEEAAQCMKSGE